LPGSGDHNALQELVSDLMSVPLERSRPLWQMHYVENVNGGSALISRLHHSIGDGISLMQVLLSMTDESAEAAYPELVEEPEQVLKPKAGFFRPVFNATDALGRSLHTAESMIHEGMNVLVHPSRLRKVVRYGTASSLALSKLLLLPPDHHTIFRQKAGVAKRAVWTSAIRLEDVKSVGRTMGGTINDILLSAVTGALRRYLEEQTQPVQGLNIRAFVPVNLRPEDELGQLGNRFGLVFLSLPVGVTDPVKRLLVLKRRMDKIKNTPEAVVALGILNLIGMTPTQVERIINSIFILKATAVMTNVPGPLKTLYLAGAPISSLVFWVPAPGNLSLGISILSYNGDVILGIASDAGIIPDPQRIIELFQVEFDYLMKWGRPPLAG